MKKILLTGIVILLAVFVVTCEDFFPAGKEVEYTDVEYSQDGSTVTVYLDGVGVPKTAAQRAMTKDLARIAYDYLEVIFVGTTGAGQPIARNSWELGQAAGISGVYKGTTGADYLWAAAKVNNVALMFVGRKDSKLLLGVGRLAEVDHSATTAPAAATYTAAIAANSSYPATFTAGVAATGLPNTPYAFILPNSKSVTFYIEAVKTGLFVSGETIPDDGIDSFDFITGGTSGSWSNRDSHSQRLSLGNSPPVNYPLYALPQVKDIPTTPPLPANGTTGGLSSDGYPLQWAKYTFAGAVSTFATQIRLVKAGAAGVNVERRLPRYLDGGVYYSPKTSFDLKSLVKVRTSYAGAADGAFVNPIPLEFEVKGNGVFSFFLEIPVYMITKADSTNSGPAAEMWKIRTGFGSELYSLDDGVDGAGGCVLMGVGNTGADWLEIDWEWVK